MTRLHYPLPTLRPGRYRPKRKARFRLVASLYREGVEPSGSLRKVSEISALHLFLLSQVYPVANWAHVRRKFDEAIKAVAADFKGEIKAKAGFALINELFRIEREDIGKDATDDLRLKIRQEKSREIIASLKAWADETAPTLPPKTLSGAAVRYILERWEKLILFLDRPFLRLDTNPVEGVIRPFVVGRNNWLYADTVKGAEASAALYSLIVMARANGRNPFLYLKAVFTELPKAKTAEDVAALLPWVWMPAPT